MAKKKEKVRTAIYIDKDILKRCDECLPLANVRSRNEFITEALRYYIGANFSQELENYTLQSVSQVIRSSISSMEDRIAKLLFKLNVSVEMLTHVSAYTNELVDDGTLGRLWAMSIENVKRTNGVIKYNDAVKFQSENAVDI